MRGSRSLPRACSGDMKATVGAIVVLAIAAGAYLSVTRPRGFNLQNNAIRRSSHPAHKIY